MGMGARRVRVQRTRPSSKGALERELGPASGRRPKQLGVQFDASIALDGHGCVTSVRTLDPELTNTMTVGASMTELLGSVGLSDADRWLADRLPAPAGPESIVVSGGSALHILTIEPLGRQSSRLRIRTVASNLLKLLLEAQVLAVGQARGLSARELQVLRLLVTGHSLDDIAHELGITSRTVKFHQANMLPKLGADSRFDVIRALL